MRLSFVIVLLLLAGCRSQPIKIPPITLSPIEILIDDSTPSKKPTSNPLITALGKQMIGPESIAGQLILGCVSYLNCSGRWPRTKEEVIDGLAREKISSNGLTELQKLTLTEIDGDLQVEFASSEKPTAEGTLRIRSPKKTPTKASSSQTESK